MSAAFTRIIRIPDASAVRKVIPGVTEPLDFAAAAAATQAGSPAVSEAELEAIRAAARDEGFRTGHEAGLQTGRAAGLAEGRALGEAEGFAQGLAQGQQQGEAQMREARQPEIERLATVLQHTDRALQAVEAQYLEFVQTLSKTLSSLLRPAPPEVLVGRIEEALTLVGNTDRLVIALHPDDLSLVEGRLSETLETTGGRLNADPLLTPGDYRITTAAGSLSAVFAEKLAQLAKVLNGQ